jgi:hypothetical protein
LIIFIHADLRTDDHLKVLAIKSGRIPDVEDPAAKGIVTEIIFVRVW